MLNLVGSMCGIFGQCCPSQSAQRFSEIIAGLTSLQYRGYDSCGIAWNEVDQDRVQSVRAIGAPKELERAVPQKCHDDDEHTWCAIAHTRWATHGAVTLENTHPHQAGGYAIVHNGVVDNAEQLRHYLQTEQNVELKSETDTELIVQLIALQPLELPLAARVANAMKEIRGANAIALLSAHEPDQVLLWRRGSPLVIGLFDDTQQPHYIAAHEICSGSSCAHASVSDALGFCFTFASDITALQQHAQRALLMSDDDIAVLDARNGACYVFYSGKHPQSTVEPLSQDEYDNGEGSDCESGVDAGANGGQQRIASIHQDYDDGLCMWREMQEQPVALRRTMAGRITQDDTSAVAEGEQRLDVLLGGLEEHWYEIATAPRLVMVACGTSYHAALAARPLFERYCHRSVVVERATPFVDRRTPIFRGDACFFLSQSGETADTLAALRHCKKHGALCVGIVNTVASSIARSTDCGLYLKCGPEIGVASTKAYTSQICVLAMIAAHLCVSQADKQTILGALRRIPLAVEQALVRSDQWARQLAAEWRDRQRCILLARGSDEATCYEAALKIKELCYVLAEGCHAGELKHGPLALVDESLAILAFRGDGEGESSELVRKMNTAIEQVAARKGRPVVISSGRQSSPSNTDGLTLPSIGNELLQCVVNIVPMQLLSFYWAKERGLHVDRPRNLAKSVTVE